MSSKELNLAVILGREGSRRLPRKNMKKLDGSPLVRRTISNLQESKLFDRILISTDDLELEKYSIGLGVESLGPRNSELCKDDVGTNEVVRHVIGSLCKDYLIQLNSVCCVYATSAFFEPSDLLASYDAHLLQPDKITMSVSKLKKNLQRAYLGELHSLTLEDSSLERRGTDTFTDRYADAGQFYWGKVGTWLSSEFGPASYAGHELPPWKAIDIDDSVDWTMAEIVLSGLSKRQC